MPSVKSAAEFGSSCIAWWRTLQPSWRGESSSREIPVDADWSPVLCGGSTGMLLVVLALAWWMNAVKCSEGGGLPGEQLSGMMRDVSWMLVEMRKYLSGKRRHDGEGSGEGQRAKKR